MRCPGAGRCGNYRRPDRFQRTVALICAIKRRRCFTDWQQVQDDIGIRPDDAFRRSRNVEMAQEELREAKIEKRTGYQRHAERSGR